jgi:hypothetical protein
VSWFLVVTLVYTSEVMVSPQFTLESCKETLLKYQWAHQRDYNIKSVECKQGMMVGDNILIKDK